MPERSDVRFISAGDELSGWHLPGEGDAFAGENGRPCVVLATGMGGTKDSSLLPFAEAFAGAGLDALLFDYRGQGESAGEPRQLASLARQRQDLRAAIAYGRGLDGVDAVRLVLWGWSWGASHAIDYASYAGPEGIAAVIAVAPDVDGVSTIRHRVAVVNARSLTRLLGRGLRDLAGELRDRPPEMVPLVGPPGSQAALNTPDSEPGYKAVAGPSWRNEVAARVGVVELSNRTLGQAHRLRCPILIQGAERDDIVDPETARKLAWEAKGRSELREYPGGHFDVLLEPLRERLIADQLHFLRRHLSPARESAASV